MTIRNILFILLSFIVSSNGILAQQLPAYSGDAIEHSVFPIDTTRSYTIDRINDSTFVKYYAPRWHDFVTNIPGDVIAAGKTLFSKQSIKPLVLIAGSTALLYLFDKPLVDGVQKLSRNLRLNPESQFKSFIKIGDINLMQYPGNVNTGFYFIGEGWTSILLFAGIGTHGALTNNQKEVQLLSQFAEGYIEMGIITQLFKHSFGRETPREATTDRGKFQFFPSFSKYQKHVSRYDAMPSGHMATMAFTVTLLAEHYPDKTWIRPVGYSLIGICAFSMLNNGVHWASDYPLGFATGYLFAKIVANRGRVLYKDHKPNLLSHFDFSPTYFATGESGLKLTFKF